MSRGQQDQVLPSILPSGSIPIALGIVGLVLTAPPTIWPRTSPLFGIGAPFFPVFIGWISLLLTIVGGVLLGEDVADETSNRIHRLAIRTVVQAAVVTLIVGYLVVGAGYGRHQSTFIAGYVILGLGSSIGSEVYSWM